MQEASLQQAFPNFFRYMRINEIQVQISYYHAPTHIANIKNFQLKMPAFISHGTFTTFRKALESYERHSKRNFISQIPNLIGRKFLQMREKVKDNMKEEIKDENDQRDKEIKKEMRKTYARKIIQGDFAL